MEINYIWKMIRKMQGIQICYFRAWQNSLKWTNSSKCNLDIFEYSFGVWIWNSISNQLQLICCNMNLGHMSTMPCYVSHLDCALQCDVYTVSFRCLILIDRSITGRTSRLLWRAVPVLLNFRQANPIDHVYKNPFPSCSRLCMIRWFTCYRSTASWTHPLHDLSFLPQY